MNIVSKLTVAAACALALAAYGGGTISPSKAVSASSGSTASFQVTPNSGYTASVGSTCGGTLSGTAYTTKAITTNCSVVATSTAASSSLTFRYETQPNTGDPAGFLQLLNQEGRKGYFYLHGLQFFLSTDMPFVNDGTRQTYGYELLDEPGNIEDFIKQANAEGAKGYRYDTVVQFVMDPGNGLSFTDIYATDFTHSSPVRKYYGVLYRKDSGSSAVTYTYASEPITESASDLVAQANRRGQSGYLLIFPEVGGMSTIGEANLYMKSNVPGVVYAYEIKTVPRFPDDLLVQLNIEGANGYRIVSGQFMDAKTWLYVKD